MLNFLYSLGFVVTLLVIWFKTDAFFEYCKIFNFKWLLFGYDVSNTDLTFPQFLFVKKHLLTKSKFCLFYIKLITCPLCLSFWFCLICGLIFINPLLVPCLYICSLFVYLSLSKLLDH